MMHSTKATLSTIPIQLLLASYLLFGCSAVSVSYDQERALTIHKWRGSTVMGHDATFLSPWCAVTAGGDTLFGLEVAHFVGSYMEEIKSGESLVLVADGEKITLPFLERAMERIDGRTRLTASYGIQEDQIRTLAVATTVRLLLPKTLAASSIDPPPAVQLLSSAGFYYEERVFSSANLRDLRGFVERYLNRDHGH